MEWLPGGKVEHINGVWPFLSVKQLFEAKNYPPNKIKPTIKPPTSAFWIAAHWDGWVRLLVCVLLHLLHILKTTPWSEPFMSYIQPPISMVLFVAGWLCCQCSTPRHTIWFNMLLFLSPFMKWYVYVSWLSLAPLSSLSLFCLCNYSPRGLGAW